MLLEVVSPLGRVFLIVHVYHCYVVSLDTLEFGADFIVLSIHNFDVFLGMD